VKHQQRRGEHFRSPPERMQATCAASLITLEKKSSHTHTPHTPP